uniref:OTU domain-containing protein n=1 Tax=Ditylenchus dipsaci TaxID=166011 RepID=A0A915DIY1_9BILA
MNNESNPQQAYQQAQQAALLKSKKIGESGQEKGSIFDETKDLLSVDEVKPIAKEFLRCVSGFLSDVDETGDERRKQALWRRTEDPGARLSPGTTDQKANHEPASKQIWEDEPWEQHPIVGDGNCLYRSIALIKYRDQELYGLVRDDLMNYLQAHKDEEWNRCFVNVEEYVQQHRKDFVWGNATHLILAARRYDMNFVMFQPNDDKNHFVNYPADFTWGKTELDESKKIGWIRLQKDHFDVVSFDRKEMFEYLLNFC